MKQAATDKKTNSTKPKTREKISASVAKKGKKPEKSISVKKTVSARSIKPQLKNSAKIEVSTKVAPKVQKAKTLNSVKQITKSVSLKVAEKKVRRTLNAKSLVSQKTDKTAVSKKTKAEPSAQKPKSVKLKIQAAKSVSPKIAKNKQSEKKIQKTEKSAAKAKVQKPKTAKTASEKNLTAKPKAAKVKAFVAKKSAAPTKKPSVAKSISAGANRSKTVATVSTPKIKKTIEKAPAKNAKTKTAIAKKTVKPVKPKTATKPKTIAPKTKNVPRKAALKAVSKTAKSDVKSKVSAIPERKDFLKYAKPAITAKVKSSQRKAASIKIEAKKIEPKILEETKEPKKKPLRAISSAVFRGEKDTYQFKVYELDESFKEIPAVYVISKRITDRRNRGHHKLICIGQTDSILKDLKTHRKSKCLRVNKANVISILREENEEVRLKIENDLKAAHSIACNLEPGANLK